MASERIQRQIDRLLDDAEQAMAAGEWETVRLRCEAALSLDAESVDARSYLVAATNKLAPATSAGPATASPVAAPPVPAPLPAIPTAFANGRYQVKRFLGEGGKKKVYLAHDTLLDRDVAFALIKTDGLDDAGRMRIRREAQAMGRLGAHPHIVSVFDLGEEPGGPWSEAQGRPSETSHGQPFLVTELMGGGDVEGLIEKAPEHRVPLVQLLAIAQAVCRGLAFAHAQGIVHRDLKPGNVWLTADGTAKLGDFGLAVALDRSRLTQVGMMVGTVSYMPPEQALGGETSPQADLYSLGAMLYELVTGRPPFLSDNPTAVITQHLNTAPVAPSWLTDACPPALEELILRLLAKRPEDRPASAEVVLAALAQIDPAERSASHSEAGANPLARLAQGVFVGREQELSRLRQVCDAAFAGRGGMVLLVGEPGIGKTRTAQELETYARMRGAQVLWGLSYENAGAPPYWPWIQIGRTWGATNDQAQIQQTLGSMAGELVRLFPELRRLPGFSEPAPVTDPETAQFALFDAYTQFIRTLAARGPLLLALDDLHWADKPTLLLLQHLARELSHLRVLVVGTYRDTELSRTHPLSETLAALNREGGFTRLVLRGLSKPEVAGYVQATAGVAPSPALLDRLFEETEGNPFFLSEVVNLLTQEGTLTAERVSDIRVPDGVREALGRRLDRLSEETNALLQVAAIIGREFAYDTLTLLDEQDEDALLRQIEDALAARVIEELPQAGRYRFTHALMQETLLGELSTTRKVRLHGQVGEALERRWGDQAEARAPRLAQHFGEAATLSARHAGKAVHYAELAAQQAEAQFAWAEAGRHYESCLTLVSGSDGALTSDEAGLLIALGRCLRNAGDYRAAWRNLMRALALLRERGDGLGLARAVLEANPIFTAPARRMALLDEALAALGEGDPYLEAQLLVASLGLDPYGEHDAARAASAAELARRHGYADIEARLMQLRGFAAFSDLRFEEGAALHQTAYDTLLRLGHVRAAAQLLSGLSILPFYPGDLDAAEANASRMLAQARRLHVQFVEQNILVRLTGLYLARAEFDRFEALARESPGDNYVIDLQRALRAEWAGDHEGALRLLPAPERAGGFPVFVAHLHGGRARVRFNAGDLDGAQKELATALEALSTLAHPRPLHTGRLYSLIEADEVLVALGDEPLVQAIYDEVAGWTGVRIDPLTAKSVDPLRGALALRLGRLEEAEAAYRTGLEWAERERCPIEQGRCLMGLAELAERRGDHGDAVKHLDHAAVLFQQHGVTLYLHQVLAKKDLLKA